MCPIDFGVKRSTVKVMAHGYLKMVHRNNGCRFEFVGVGGGPVLLQQYFQYAFTCCPYMLPLLLYKFSLVLFPILVYNLILLFFLRLRKIFVCAWVYEIFSVFYWIILYKFSFFFSRFLSFFLSFPGKNFDQTN